VSVNTSPLLPFDGETVITRLDIFGFQSLDPQQEGGCVHGFIDFTKLKLTFMAYKRLPKS
jgi:hypothetical protein